MSENKISYSATYQPYIDYNNPWERAKEGCMDNQKERWDNFYSPSYRRRNGRRIRASSFMLWLLVVI